MAEQVSKGVKFLSGQARSPSATSSGFCRPRLTDRAAFPWPSSYTTAAEDWDERFRTPAGVPPPLGCLLSFASGSSSSSVLITCCSGELPVASPVFSDDRAPTAAPLPPPCDVPMPPVTYDPPSPIRASAATLPVTVALRRSTIRRRPRVIPPSTSGRPATENASASSFIAAPSPPSKASRSFSALFSCMPSTTVPTSVEKNKGKKREERRE
ncbi:hypothetical protein EAO74_01260 [Streptomyces sp. gb1(2016)]|uniref:Uncharacterized protein n=1 Tax=Streptomyces sp. gb1(2016) TaxID=1828321 RepID=A0A652LE68_9ACTN|nr:hypothetical protein EAO74_01260 [Streptomyces sp. gb1(2016)]